jgi:predicted nucleic acid-binding protein
VRGGITYDAGALLAAEAGRIDIWTLHRNAQRRDIRPVVPAVVLAQAWRGGPQGLLSRFLKGCDVEPLVESYAREAGRACSLAGSSDIVDAAVAVGALRRDDLVVTSDPRDLTRIADALNQKLSMHLI